MSFKRHGRTSRLLIRVAAAMIMCGSALAQNYDSLSVNDVMDLAQAAVQRGDYSAAIAPMQEVLDRIGKSTDPNMQKAAQAYRLELARAYYQLGQVSTGVELVREFLDKEPREPAQERQAIRMLCQGFFEESDWDKIIEYSDRLRGYPNLSREDLLSMNLLLGQAYFKKEEWEKSIDPLRYAEANTRDEQTRGVCQVMVARALVESEQWEQLFGWVRRLENTDRRYDISLNLAFMGGAKGLYEGGEYLNALYLYRMVLPRETLILLAQKRITEMEAQLEGGTLTDFEERNLQNQIDGVKQSIEVVTELPPYEEEVTFRIGQIYAEVKRYWEGLVLFDKLYRENPDGEIGEAAGLQAVQVFYAIADYPEAERRIITYLEEKPDGVYARTLLTLAMQNNLERENFERVIELSQYLDVLPATEDPNERLLEADMHFMLAFAYMQSYRYKEAGEEFTLILNNYADGPQAPDATFYRGLSFLLQGEYDLALNDFMDYQNTYPDGSLFQQALFREGVCRYGLEDTEAAEQIFSRFIEEYPANDLVSEAYSLRADLRVAKDYSGEGEHPVDQAQKDYWMAISTATSPLQASYPATRSAEAYKQEGKWPEIIERMDAYIDRWGDQADIAEAIYWKGQAQMRLGNPDEVIQSYMNAIIQFGDAPDQFGVDKIIGEMVKIARNLSEQELDTNIRIIQRRLDDTIDESRVVLRLRLRVAKAMLQGEEATKELGSELLKTVDDLELTSPSSLYVMCDAAVESGDVEQMLRLGDYFVENFEESDLAWHGYRAKTAALLQMEEYDQLLPVVEAAQGLFGADEFMGWAQLAKGKAQFELGRIDEAIESYKMIQSIPQWRNEVIAEAYYNIGNCYYAQQDWEKAHHWFQRTYLQWKAFDNAKWAAMGYLKAADCLDHLNRGAEAKETRQAMLDDQYIQENQAVLSEYINEANQRI